MRLSHNLSVFLLFAILVLGCGKKPGPDAPPAPEPNPTTGGQPAAGSSSGIEGTYLITAIELWGEKMYEEGGKDTKESDLERTVKINKDRIQFRMFRRERETVRYKIDPSKSPAEIDLFPEETGKKSVVSYGIYKVEGKMLILFIVGANEPQLRPREFKTLNALKDGKPDKIVEKQVGGFMMLTLKKVSDDVTFISNPTPKPKPPEIDDGPVVDELTKKGFIAEKQEYGKFAGINVTVPVNLPLGVIKELNGRPRIRSITFKKKVADPDHPVTDAAVQGLNKLDGLTSLTFEWCPKITAAAFRDLTRFPMLTFVDVSSSPVDDAVTEELARVKTLEQVRLDGTKLTDKSLANLARIKTLKTLWLRDARVTAAGIKMLNALPDLEFLALQGLHGADAALGELNLPKLEFLNLAQSDLTDEGLSKLPVLPKLRNLTLTGPRVTDAGLKYLQKQPSLDSLTLFETKVTKAGAEELKKLKPKLFISGAD